MTPLTPRAELRSLPGGRTLVSTPADHHYVVDVDTATVLRVLDASSGADVPLLPPDWRESCGPLLEVLEVDGCLVSPAPDGDPPPPSPAPDGPPRPGDLLLLGDGDLTDALARTLGATGGQSAGRAARVTVPDTRAAVHRAFRTGEIVVHCVPGGHDDVLAAFDRLSADARTPWVAVEVSRSTAWVGPFVTPGVGACWEDLAARRAAAAFDGEVDRALRRPSATGDAGAPVQALTRLMSTVAALLAGDHPGPDVAVRVGHDGTATRHPVLPLPGNVTSDRIAHRPDDLVDAETGLVLRTRTVRHHPDVPRRLVTVQTDVANVRRISRWANNTSCQGSAFDDGDRARAAATGESVERYCGNLLDTLPVTAGSYDHVRRGRVRALDPADLVLYSDAQYDAPGFPFVRLSPDLPVHWVPGRSLTHDEDVLVPASLVYVNWFTAGYSGAPLTNFCPFAGIAAGPDLEFATMSALEEVIERHVTMVWWLNGHVVDAVRPGPALDSLWEGTREAGQRPSLLALDNEFGVPVVAGVLHHDRDDLLNVGFSARHDVATAASKAWTEALTLQEGSRDLLPQDGAHWRAMAGGELNGRSFKPWRADRRYLDDFREDMRDCDDLMVQQQVFLDPRAVARVAPLLDRPATRDLADVASLPERSLAAYRRSVEQRGHEVVVVDLTSPDVRSTGMAVVRVVVPGTVGNAPAAFPFLGRGRVQDIPVELGWRETRAAEEDLHYFPLPHA
ncbi:MAG: TOMM precursor leader peptide-binding protein [Actinomycetales bacterium]